MLALPNNVRVGHREQVKTSYTLFQAYFKHCATVVLRSPKLQW